MKYNEKDDAFGYFLWSEGLTYQGELDEAIEMANAGIDKATTDSDLATMYCALADATLEKGDITKAKETLAEARRLAPGSEYVKALSGKIK